MQNDPKHILGSPRHSRSDMYGYTHIRCVYMYICTCIRVYVYTCMHIRAYARICTGAWDKAAWGEGGGSKRADLP